MIHDLLPSLRVLEIPLKTRFRGITVREVAIMEGAAGPVEFSPFLEYNDHESAQWLKCTLEAAATNNFPRFRDDVALNGTIPETNEVQKLNELLDSFGNVRTFKVKVGSNLRADIERLNFIQVKRPDARLRIDVNGLLSVDAAAEFLNEINRSVGEIEYVEQPCATIEELRELKTRINTRIAADEVIRKAADPFAIDISDAADVLVLKAQPLGGIARSLAIAEHHKKPVVVSSALESQVGLNYGIRLAQAVEFLSYDCGLATTTLFSGPGRNVAPERLEWWKNRIMRCAEIVGE